MLNYYKPYLIKIVHGLLKADVLLLCNLQIVQPEGRDLVQAEHLPPLLQQRERLGLLPFHELGRRTGP